jgi:PAS domain S-box-containing protein
MVHRIVRPEGVERVVSERGAVSVDAEGKPVRMVGTVQDITERWQAEQALQAAHDALESRVEERTANLLEANRALEVEIARRAQTEAALSASELRLRTVVSGAPVVVFVLDAQGVFQLSEGRGLANLGLKPGEVVGQSVFAVYEDVPQVMDNVRRALAGEEVSMVTQVRDDWFESRCSPLFDAQGAVSGVIGVATNITVTKQAELSRLEDLRGQRDALVREVHHRIKNNLQGVIGLLRQQSQAHPELRSVMAQAIAQVHSVAIVYGLHSERANADIMICDMLQAISRSLNEIYSDALPLSLDLAVAKPIQVAKEEAVPVALIMNELITNALKHGKAEGATGPVTVRLWGDCESAQISVRNAGVLSPDFSLAERRGIGTGLNLVLALLPRDGAMLAIEQDQDAINARITLAPPVICNLTID